LLNKNKVKYLIVGGYAFAIYAEPRYTKDMDIFLLAEERNSERVVQTLKDFGFKSLSIKIRDLIKPGRVIQMGNPPMRIDLLTSITGVKFFDAWKNKIPGKYGKQKVWFIGKKDFIKNKKASGRKKDLQDLDWIYNCIK
jgi:hypothetical protein